MARRRAALVGTAAALLTVLLTGPAAVTQARWTETEHAQLPALSTGRIALDVRGTAQGKNVEAALANGSGFGLEYGPAQVRFERRPGSQTTDADVTRLLDLGAGTAFAYHPSMTQCATSTVAGRWSAARRDNNPAVLTAPVTGGSAARDPLHTGTTGQSLCLAVRPDATQRDAWLNAAGREYQVTTTVRATTVAPGSWSSDVPWTSPYAVSLPAPSARAQNSCTVNGGTATLSWAWPDTATSTAVASPAVHRWEVLGRIPGRSQQWTPVTQTTGSARSLAVSSSALTALAGNGSYTYEMIVRAYPFAGSTKYVDSTGIWPVNVRGNSIRSCQNVVANPDSRPVGYDLDVR